MTHPGARDLMPGERVLWQGRPSWQALARDLLHVRLVALYFALFLIWGAHADRSGGRSPAETLLAGVPLLALGVAVLAGCAAFAWACAWTTSYVVTDRRCILSFGMALTATLSVPLGRIAVVAVTLRADGTGDIPLALKPGQGVAFLKLWPHVRPWRFSRAQPMLRGVAGAAEVATLLSQAVAAVSPGSVAAVPAQNAGVRAPGFAPATAPAAVR